MADVVAIAAAAIMLGACHERAATPLSGGAPSHEEQSVNHPPISEVLARHTPRLLSVDGVTGTGEGADGGQPIVVVFVVEDTRELRARLPQSLEGYPVVLRASGKVTAPPR
jgi:hypothetical protein